MYKLYILIKGILNELFELKSSSWAKLCIKGRVRKGNNLNSEKRAMHVHSF